MTHTPLEPRTRTDTHGTPTHPRQEGVHLLLRDPPADAHPGAGAEGEGGVRVDGSQRPPAQPPVRDELLGSREVLLIPGRDHA